MVKPVTSPTATAAPAVLAQTVCLPKLCLPKMVLKWHAQTTLLQVLSCNGFTSTLQIISLTVLDTLSLPKLCLPKLVLTWHAMQAFPTAAQRLLNFDSDLADGLALGSLLISHIPRLAFLASQLNLAPTTPAELQNNAILVIKMTVEIQLPWPIQVASYAVSQNL